MGSFSGVGIGLCFVLGSVLMGFVGAEVYYLFWWKKRSSDSSAATDKVQGCLCWRKPTCEEVGNSVRKSQEQEEDVEMGAPKMKVVKSSNGEDSAEMIMRMHNLSGPPRFLFTIKEEEGLEYSSSSDDDDDDDWKSSRLVQAASGRRSLSELIFGENDTLLATQTATATGSGSEHGMINPPVFESAEEVYGLRSSPPPQLKFLKDAEDKLIRRLVLALAVAVAVADRKRAKSEEEEAVKSAGGSSFVNKRDDHQASSAQLLPLSLCSKGDRPEPDPAN